MSKSLRIAKYGQHIIELALACGTEQVIEMENEKAAFALRFELYGLRRAIIAEQAEAFYGDFMRAKIKVEGNILRISPPEAFNLGWASAIEKALGKKIEAPLLSPSGPATGAAAKQDLFEAKYGIPEKPSPRQPTAQSTLPKDFDPYEIYAATIEKDLAQDTTIESTPPVDPFDLTETRNKIDSFTTAVNAWLAGGEEGK